MKRLLVCVLIAATLLLVCACVGRGVETDYAAVIQVEGKHYALPSGPSPVEIDPSAIIGETQSYTDAYPDEDWEQNFDRELGAPVASVEDGVAVLRGNEWYICTPVA